MFRDGRFEESGGWRGGLKRMEGKGGEGRYKGICEERCKGIFERK